MKFNKVRPRVIWGSLAAVVVLLWALFSPDAFDILGASKAIRLAKEAHTIDREKNNESEILEDLTDIQGVIKVDGWTCTKVEKDTYVVTFKFLHNGGVKGFVFEVNTRFGLVRDVFESRALIEKYGFPLPPKSQVNSFVKIVREQFPDDPRSDDLITLEMGRWAAEKRPDLLESDPVAFASYVHIEDRLNSAGHRLVMPSPTQFIQETKMNGDM